MCSRTQPGPAAAAQSWYQPRPALGPHAGDLRLDQPTTAAAGAHNVTRVRWTLGAESRWHLRNPITQPQELAGSRRASKAA
jgi:hypothetical protein